MLVLFNDHMIIFLTYCETMENIETVTWKALSFLFNKTQLNFFFKFLNIEKHNFEITKTR